MKRTCTLTIVCMICLVVASQLALLAAATPAQMQSLGVGMWVWKTTITGNPQAMAAQAVKYHLGHVLLKANDGRHRFVSRERLDTLADAFNAQGVKVLAWGYTHATIPNDSKPVKGDTEAEIIIKILDNPRFVGYVFNTEDKLSGGDSAERAEKMFAQIEKHRRCCYKCREKMLGFAPYALPSLHGSLPYVVLVKHTDFIMPQVYWADWNMEVRPAVLRTYHDWLNWQRKNGLSKPILPIGQSYPVKNGPDPGDILQFKKETHGYYSVSFWDWQHCEPWMWEEISGNEVSIPVQPTPTPWGLILGVSVACLLSYALYRWKMSRDIISAWTRRACAYLSPILAKWAGIFWKWLQSYFKGVWRSLLEKLRRKEIPPS